MAAPAAALRFDGAVFDLDGTLLDTEPLYFAAYASVSAQFTTEPYTFSGVHYALLGRPEHVGAAAFARILDVPLTAEEVIARRDVHFLEHLRAVVPLPGALRVVEHMASLRLPMAIATSSSREYLQIKAAGNAVLFSPFGADRCVCGTDEVMRGKRGKPAPDIFLAAAALLMVDPRRCIAFEDAIAGIEAAKAAGMYVVAIPDPRLTAEEVAAARPDLVLASLADFDVNLLKK